MSHFTVLVTASNERDLEARLLPFHEYECTGIEAYTQLVELGQDYLDDYIKDDGSLDEERLAEYYTKQDGKWYRRTNPNRKWDWYKIGGRWTGALLLKQANAPKSGNGHPGLMTDANIDEMRADYAMAKDIDWNAMYDKKLQREIARHAAYQQAIRSQELAEVKTSMIENATKRFGDGSGWGATWAKSADDVAEAWAIDKIASSLLGDDSPFGSFDFEDHPKYRVDSQEFLENLSVPAMAYAFIDMEGNWHQRAEMGWWGCSDKSKATDDYDKLFWEFVKSIPGTKTVYIIDCHI